MQRKEKLQSFDSQSITDPKEFLQSNYDYYACRQIPSAPELDLLKWVINLPGEVGFVYHKQKWILIKGSEDGVPVRLLPTDWDIFIHSHPIIPCDDKEEGCIPSLNDLINASKNAKNIIISEKGITQYYPPKNADRDQMIIAFFDWIDLEINIDASKKQQEYLNFLAEIDAGFVTYPWEEINDEKLSELLSL